MFDDGFWIKIHFLIKPNNEIYVLLQNICV